MKKKLISIAALAVLTTCTAPQEASSIGNGAAAYDMNAVQIIMLGNKW